jgi:hypothetical protein
MAFDVSTLVNYVIENTDVLVTKSIFGARTSDLIRSEGTVMTGVKFAEQINILDTDATFQDGSGCTRTSSGTTRITQRKVTVGNVAIVEDICVKDLRTKYLSKTLAKGSQENSLAFEQDYTDLKAKTIAKQVEIALWQGDTASGNANLSRFDGLTKLIDNSTVAINGNPTAITVATGITAANVVGIVNGVVAKLPADVLGQDDVRIFCGWDTFMTYVAAYTALNLFAFAPSGSETKAAAGEIIIPGTYYRLTAVHGLDATSRLFGLRMSNLYEGTDLEGEEEDWSIMEDQFKDYLRFKAAFKMGVQVAFPNEIVSFKLV